MSHAYHEDSKAGRIVLVGIVGAIVTFAAIVAISALFVSTKEQEIRKKAEAAAMPLGRRVQNEQYEKILTYRVVDREKGIVAIPVDRAMDILVREAEAKGGR